MKNQKTEFIQLCVIISALFMLMTMTCCGSKDQPDDETDFNEIGMTLFKEGFYDLLPKGKTDDATAKFALAEKAFKQAVAVKPDSAESHRYLARTYSMQQKLSDAAAEYMKTIEIEPGNLDNYLFLSSVYVRMKRYDDALNTLNHAKALSKESAVIELIDDLIKKIREKALN
jgi:tetratricopeptide (TPR) repeat protein